MHAHKPTRTCMHTYPHAHACTQVRLLTSCSTFDEVIRLTESGSSANVDMLVGDIYGGDCDAIGLKSDVIAASFGKISMQREEDNSIGPMLLLRYVRALVRHYEEVTYACACGHAGMRACGHAGMRACGHAGMRACVHACMRGRASD